MLIKTGNRKKFMSHMGCIHILVCKNNYVLIMVLTSGEEKLWEEVINV